MYLKNMYAGWGDMDFNMHMKNTAYLDKSGDVRMMFFSDNGFPMSEFGRLRIGPVVMKDEVEYFKEVTLLQEMSVTLLMAGLAPDGSRFMIRNEFYRQDDKLCARVTSSGGWLSLTERKLVVPPAGLQAALYKLDRTGDFIILGSSIK